MHFTLKQLTYFVAAAEAGSITLAAERVNISQPSVSSAITLLEENFGIQLFIRHHAQGLSLTNDGQRFLRQARALLQQAAELQNAASELSSQIAGPLEIGCLATLFSLVVPELVQLFRQRHRNVTIDALAGNQSELFESLRYGKTSLVLTFDMELPNDMVFLPLAKLQPFAFVASNHPLARRRSVRLAELASEPFLLLDLPLSRAYFLGLFKQAGVVPQIAARYAQLDIIRSLIARGEGYSIANAQPRNQAALDGRQLAYLALEPELRALTYGIATLKGARRSPSVSAFIQLCEEVLAGKKLPGAV